MIYRADFIFIKDKGTWKKAQDTRPRYKTQGTRYKAQGTSLPAGKAGYKVQGASISMQGMKRIESDYNIKCRINL